MWWAQNTDAPYGFCWCGCGESTTISLGTQRSALHFRGEPRRYVFGHAHRPTPAGPAYREEERGHETACWVWQRGVNSNGYGVLGFRGKTIGAHRFFYEQENGPVLEHHELHHHELHHECNVPLCVRPSHLIPLLRADHAKTRKSTKLTKSDVVKMRELYRMRGVGCTQLGKMFGVTREHAGRIVTNRYWKPVSTTDRHA